MRVILPSIQCLAAQQSLLRSPCPAPRSRRQNFMAEVCASGLLHRPAMNIFFRSRDIQIHGVCVEQRPLRAPEAPSRECRARGGVLCIARGSDDLRCMFCHTADMHADFGMRLCWCLGRHGGAAVLRHQVRASPPHLLHASPVLLHSTHPVCGFCSIRSPPGTSCHSTPRPSSDSTFTRARTALTTAPTSAATATRR